MSEEIKNGTFIDELGYTKIYKNDKFHNDNGPAVISTDKKYKRWFQNGEPHRLDGPAIEWKDGTKHFYLYGIPIVEEYFHIFNKNIPLLLWIKHNSETNIAIQKQMKVSVSNI